MTLRSRSHKDSFLFKILEDVYNASSLCRPEIDQFHATNNKSKGTRSVSFSPTTTKIGIHGVSAPTTLKNYRIPIQRPYSANIKKHLPMRRPYVHGMDSPTKKSAKKKSRKRPSTARTPRTFYKNSKQIENQCNTINKRRIRPISAPIKRSKSALNIHKTRNNKSPKAYDKSISHYKSTSNLIFRQKQQPKLNKYNLNQFVKHKKHNGASHSFTINKQPQNVNESKSIPELSRSEWIQTYIKDQKENLFALDEFARMKLMELDRINQQKDIQQDVDDQNEFDSVIPDVDENDANIEKVRPIHPKDRVNDTSLRMALYIDLLSMISNDTTTHSQLLKYLISEITKYTFSTNESSDKSDLSKLCQLSTYFDEATYYKQKYETLLGEMENLKKKDEKSKHQSEKLIKLNVIRLLRKEHLGEYFHEWRIIKNMNKFKNNQNHKIKAHCLDKWKGSMQNIKIWNLEAKTESLCNELNRKQVYHEIYIGRNEELLQEIKTVKEVLSVICDAVHSNDGCDACSSAWHKKVDQHIQSLKVKHAFVQDLF